MSWPWLVLLVLAAALAVAVERPRLERRFGPTARKSRDRAAAQEAAPRHHTGRRERRVHPLRPGDLDAPCPHRGARPEDGASADRGFAARSRDREIPEAGRSRPGRMGSESPAHAERDRSGACSGGCARRSPCSSTPGSRTRAARACACPHPGPGSRSRSRRPGKSLWSPSPSTRATIEPAYTPEPASVADTRTGLPGLTPGDRSLSTGGFTSFTQ